MATTEPSYSYDVYIPTVFLPENAKPHMYTTTIYKGKEYVTHHWFLSKEYFREPQGFTKYDIGERERKNSSLFFRPFLNKVFPETKLLPDSTDPLFLFNFDLGDVGGHAEEKVYF
jgi:hypothetical protein